MYGFGKGELFGDGSGAGKALTTAFVAGDGGSVRVDGETEIVCTVTISTLACSTVRLRAEWSPDNSTFIELPPPIDASGRWGNGSFPGAVGTEQAIIYVPKSGFLRLKAARVDGGGTTTLYVYGYARSALGLRELLRAPRTVMRARALDNAGTAITLQNGVFDNGQWIDMNHGDLLLLIIDKTGAGAPTEVQIRLQLSDDGGTTQYPADLINFVSGGKEQHAAGLVTFIDIGAGSVYRLARVEIPSLPGDWVARIGACYSGGTAPDIIIDAVSIQSRS